MKLKEIPKTERPRERLISSGARSLSDSELLAIILKQGTKKESVLTLAQKVISSFKSIKNLGSASYFELLKIPGIKVAKATAILAAIELGRRIYLIKDQFYKINNTIDAFNLLSPIMKDNKSETFYLIALNNKSEVLLTKKLFEGSGNIITLDMKKIFSEALKIGAKSIIIAHNHPSGDSNPSLSDIKTTDKIIKASNLLEINLIDHLIIGNGEFYSFLGKKKTII